MLAWDTETERFGPGRMAPPLACVSWADRSGGAGLLGYRDAEEWFSELLRSDVVSVGHHIAYDTCVMASQFPRLIPHIFDAYLEDRITDTMLREQLLDNADGCLGGEETSQIKEDLKTQKRKKVYVKYTYRLDDVARRMGLPALDKTTFRTSYGALREIPVERWEKGARDYAINDAVYTLKVADMQEARCALLRESYLQRIPHIDNPQPLADQFNQARSGFWLQLMSVWGIRTDPDRVNQLEQFVTDELWKLRKTLSLAGLVRGDGSRDTKAAKARMIEVMGGLENCQTTETGEVSLAEDACVASCDGLLTDYAELTSLGNVLSKDVKAFRQGGAFPIHSRFTVILETGRTSSSNPNIQNVRRLQGIRECFVPRPGMVFLDADYDGLELRTLAQVCTYLHQRGHISKPSRLAQVLNSGGDPHLAMGASILGISYEESLARKKAKDPEVADARQLAKAPNFGFPGGLGARTFVAFARGYGQEISVERAQELKALWFDTFPEMVGYFEFINSLSVEWADVENIDGRDKEITKELYFLEQLFSKRLRGGATFCAAANSFFQGLGADATKRAGFFVAKECYADPTSPLYGCRTVDYIHDQFLVECPEARCHEAAMRLVDVMVEAANYFLPDVPATVGSPMVVRCWSKEAEAVFDPETLKLIPWDADFHIKQRADA
jgi:hypothetical protein